MSLCGGCGNDKAIRVHTVWERADPKTGAGRKMESCEGCDGSGTGRGVPVDAAGQPISFPTGGFYSVAIGDRYWGSKSEFVDHIKKNNFVARPDLAMGRKGGNHDGFRNARGSKR